MQHHYRIYQLLLVSAFLLMASAVAGNPGDTTLRPKRIYTTQRTAHPPLVDGKLIDSCWHTGEWQTNFSQYSPVYGAKAFRPTYLKILYDDKYLYVALRMVDEIDKITKRLGRRDNFDGDLAGITIDSYFDHRTAFEFDLTAAGQKLDVFVHNDGWDMNWDAVWDGKVGYEDTAWTAEFRIPLSQLRYSSAPDQVWGMNVWRTINRFVEESHWNRIANDGTGLVYTFGELHGLTGMKKARRLELAPYFSTKLTTNKRIPNNPFATGSRYQFRAGLDAKIGISNNFTLNATVNPDFGQVESDPSVMNLTAFETYFEEKRPFFTEGKNIFEFKFDEDQLFYSRRIGHAPSFRPAYDTLRMPEFTNIGGAFKFSGKTAKGLSIGIIESVTPQTMAEIHDHNVDSKMAVEPFTNYFVGRFQQDFDQGNTIFGGILTHSHRSIRTPDLRFLSSNAFTYGMEFTRYWKDRKYFVEARVIGSAISGDRLAIGRLQTASARYFQRPDFKGISLDTNRTNLNGVGASFRIGKWSKGHWRFNEELIYRSPGLETNDLGFMLLANLIKNNLNLSYFERINTKVFKNYSFVFQHQNAWDAKGVHVYNYEKLTAQAEFMNNWQATLTTQYNYSYRDEWILRGGPSMLVPNQLGLVWMVQSSFAKKFIFAFKGMGRTGAQSSLRFWNLAPEFSFRPVSNLLLSVLPMYTSNVDELQFIGPFSKLNGTTAWMLGRVNNKNLAISFRADLALTPQLTIQYYGSPFVSVGQYTRFKEVTNPLDARFENRFAAAQAVKNGTQLEIDDNKDGVADFSMPNPDFSYQQFRSNLVLRWEYKVGSTLFLVWSQDRTLFDPAGDFDLGSGFSSLRRQYPGNLFMVKFSYLFRN